MNFIKKCLLFLLIILLNVNLSYLHCKDNNYENKYVNKPKILVQSFLGNEKRKFYGNGKVPENLGILWKIYVGGGETIVWKTRKKWFGIGWTGQPVLYEEKGKRYIIIGAFDHNLRKIDAETGEVIWKYAFDDVIKGTATLMQMEDSIIILQGSRRGTNTNFTDKVIPSFRAISAKSGKEIWRFNVRLTDSYSRDVDGSALIYNDKIILGAENGYLYILDPYLLEIRNGIRQPKIVYETKLYDTKDISKHKWNLVVESSPSILNNIIYVAAGSGHIYGINFENGEKIFDFKTGSDMDGSVIITENERILCSIEKQYINGKGGVIKIDPNKDIKQCVDWYFPTKNIDIGDWQGGVIGSPAINDYIKDKSKQLVAFNAIDGYMYVVSLNETVENKMVLGFDSINVYKTPKLLFKKYIGGSISTPLFIDNYLITAGYDCMLRVFKIDYEHMKFDEVSSISFPGSIEATPIVYNGKIYIGCRDGYFYCITDKEK